MAVHYEKAFDIRKFLEENESLSSEDHVDLNEEKQKILIKRVELLESLLERAMPLLERSKRIIADQVVGVPHLIETPLENLRFEIDEALFETEIK